MEAQRSDTRPPSEGAASEGAASDREIAATRVFDAPRELVFRMWTDPEHVAQWWGPRGFTNTIHEMDVRPGGVWRFVMHGPDGADYPNRIVFLTVEPPERLVYRHSSDQHPEPDAFEVTVTFEAEGERTRVGVRMVFASPAERDRVAGYGAGEGLHQTLERLAEHLAAT